MKKVRISTFLIVKNPLLELSKKNAGKDNLFILHSIYPESLIRVRENSECKVFVKCFEINTGKKKYVLDVIRNYDNATDEEIWEMLKLAVKWFTKYLRLINGL